MDLITYLSKKTINIINKLKIIELFDLNDYIYVENLIKKYRKKKDKEIKITEIEIRQLVENGLLIFWSEIIKCIIVLTIAKCLGIFWQTFLIMNIFSALRALAGGVHFNTFNKCFIAMIFFFLSLGYLSSQIHMNFLTINIVYALSMIFAYKFAPNERPDKTDKDYKNGNKRKMLVMMFIYICLLIVSMLYYYNTLITNAITIGVLLEMVTVTPWGIKFFKWLDDIEVSK